MTYSARKVKAGLNIMNKKEEVTISFLRDKSFDEEFFFVVESREFNPKTGCKDKKLIAIDDIDEIVHVEGFQFQIFFIDDKDP